MRRGVLLAALFLAGGCGSSEPTFTRDVAPVVFARCAPCHRPGGAAPFPLSTYEDVRRRARQIADVTESRYMPPWLPEPGHGAFDTERLLTAEEIDLIRRWAETGAAEGAARDLPALPRWAEGWELGEPDLVVEMDPFDLPAEGGDVFRNFVVPVPLDGPRFVEAVELQPSEPRLVHHATITIDPTPSSRRLDEKDPELGFDGMLSAPGAVMPDGHFLGWTPGRSARRERPGMSFRLAPGSDLVLQLHMPTTGKPERVSAKVGLFFTTTRPSVIPATIRLGSRRFEIPAGAKDYAVEDSYVLPIDVTAIAVYPHAHYLARDMKAKATLPDGREEWLLWIREWDFNWQDFYRYREPLLLPKGTRVTMHFLYDASEDNPRNPNRPPRNVAYGPRSTDEMGDLYLQVLPVRASEIDVLSRDYRAKELGAIVDELTFRIERDPMDADAWNSLGVAYDELGRAVDAIEAFRAALRIDPGRVDAHSNLGTLLSQRRGRASEALRHFERAIETEPECFDCRLRRGILLRDLGRLEEALAELEWAAAFAPEQAWAQYNLGIALQMRGEIDGAIARYREVVRLTPDDPEPRLSLGSLLVASDRCTPALRELEEAVRLEPSWPEAMSRLAYGLARCPQAAPDALPRAVALASEAAEATSYSDPDVLDSLAHALAASGRAREAEEAWRQALALAERMGNRRLAEDLRRRVSTR